MCAYGCMYVRKMQSSTDGAGSTHLMSSGGNSRNEASSPVPGHGTPRGPEAKKPGSVASSSKSGSTKMYHRAVMQDAQVIVFTYCVMWSWTTWCPDCVPVCAVQMCDCTLNFVLAILSLRLPSLCLLPPHPENDWLSVVSATSPVVCVHFRHRRIPGHHGALPSHPTASWFRAAA